MSEIDLGSVPTREELQAAGVGFDTSLPQEWFDRVLLATGVNPYGRVVWVYDKDGGLFGRPVGVTQVGAVIVEVERRLTDLVQDQGVIFWRELRAHAAAGKFKKEAARVERDLSYEGSADLQRDLED